MAAGRVASPRRHSPGIFNLKRAILRAGGAGFALIAVVSLAACSGGVATTDTSTTVAATNYTIGGTVSGLSGSGLTLQNNGGDTLAIAASGSFSFPTTLITGNAYNVSVLAQPTAPSQTCAVSHGSGIVAEGSVTAITVQCVTKTAVEDSIGGTVTGLLGTGLVLQENGSESQAIASNGPFTFGTTLPPGLPYTITVATPPINPYQDCIVAAGAGTTGPDNVTNVTISCTTNVNPTHTIGGTVSGVSSTSPLVLQDNGRDNLSISADGPFQFSLPIPSGSIYNVTSLPITGQQSQTCTFSNASGSVGASDITNVSVACKPNVTVSVSVSGLAGSGLVLQNNGGDNLNVSQDGTATFATAIAAGAAYHISVLSQPANPTQDCVIAGGTGSATPPAVSGTITVTCTTLGYRIGGSISGLAGTGLVLQNNRGDNLNVTANGAFAFTTPLPQGSTYSVTVLTQPSAVTQQCTVASGATGTVQASDVTSVVIRCVTSSFTLGGSMTGLGTGPNALSVTLQVNGGAGYTVTGNGPFTFPNPLPSGTAYTVTATPASGDYCGLGNATGAITNANVTTVAVNCVVIGGYVFVTNGGDNTVSTLLVDNDTGALLPSSTAATGASPRSIVAGCALGSSGPDSLFVANFLDNTLSGFDQDEFTGILTPTGDSPIAVGTGPSALNETGVCVLLATNAGSNTLLSFVEDETFGTLTAQSTVATGTNPVALATTISTTTSYTYVADQGSNDVTAYSVDDNDGVVTKVAAAGNPVATGTTPSAVALQSLNTAGTYVYVTNAGDNTISEFAQQGNGTITQLLDANGNPIVATTGATPDAITIADIFVNGSGVGDYVYIGNALDGTVSGYLINTTVGGGVLFGQLVSTGAPVATGAHPIALQFVTLVNGNGVVNVLYVVNNQSNSVSAFTIDPTSGALTPVPGSPFVVGTGPTSIAFENPPDI